MIDDSEKVIILALMLILVAWLVYVIPVFGQDLNKLPYYLGFPFFSLGLYSLITLGIYTVNYLKKDDGIIDSLKKGFGGFILYTFVADLPFGAPYALMANNEFSLSFLSNSSADYFVANLWLAIWPYLQTAFVSVQFSSILGIVLSLIGAIIYMNKNTRISHTTGAFVTMIGFVFLGLGLLSGAEQLGVLYLLTYIITPVIAALIGAFVYDSDKFHSIVFG